MAQCTAKSKRSGDRCKRSASVGRTVCNIHGGKTLRGKAHPAFKDGRRSKAGRYGDALPERLFDAYTRTIDDPHVIHLTSELALLDARMHELLAQIDQGDPMTALQEIKEAYDAFAAQETKGDVSGMSAALDELRTAILKERPDTGVWAQIIEIVDARRRVANTQRRIIMDEQNVVTAAQAMTLAQTLVSIIRDRVRDPNVLQAIKEDFAAVMMLESGKTLHDVRPR